MTNKELLYALNRIEALVLSLPSGIDAEADAEDLTPEDTTAHLGGLIYQEVQRLRQAVIAKELTP